MNSLQNFTKVLISAVLIMCCHILLLSKYKILYNSLKIKFQGKKKQTNKHKSANTPYAILRPFILYNSILISQTQQYN